MVLCSLHNLLFVLLCDSSHHLRTGQIPFFISSFSTLLENMRWFHTNGTSLDPPPQVNGEKMWWEKAHGWDKDCEITHLQEHTTPASPCCVSPILKVGFHWCSLNGEMTKLCMVVFFSFPLWICWLLFFSIFLFLIPLYPSYLHFSFSYFNTSANGCLGCNAEG